MRVSNRSTAAYLVALAVAAGGVTACGSSDDGGGSGSGGSSASADTTAATSGADSAAAAAVKTASAPAKLSLPADPLDMKKNKGKVIYDIAPSLQIPFVAQIARAMKKAGAAAGIKVVVVDGKGKADVFNQGVSNAVSQHADGIVLHAIDPAIVSGPLAQAKKAGIKVVDLFNRGPETPLPSSVDAQVTLDYPQSGRTMADYIAADSGGKGKVGVITWGIYQIYKEMLPAFKEELAKACPDCDLKTVKDVSPTAPATELQNLTTAMLRQYPDMNYVAPVSDALGMQMIPALEAAGRPVKMVSADGTDAALEAVQKGDPFVANVSDPPLDSVSWAVVDQIGRLMAGQPAAKENASLPTQLFTAGKVPPLAERWPGFAGFEDKYLSLWGLSK